MQYLKYLGILLCSFFYLNAFVPNSYEFTLVEKRETNNSYIALIKDENDTHYIIKQKKHSTDLLIRCVIRDALAAYIAHSIGIPAHKVGIISAQKFFLGKKFKRLPATIHSVVPGKAVDTLKNSYKDMCLQQKWGPRWPTAERGLTYGIIQCMAKHEDLIRIVALDTYIGNADRTLDNILYDEEQDRFYAIDMDDTFNRDLGIIAYSHLVEMYKDLAIRFTAEEINALYMYGKTLKILIKKFPPQVLHKKLNLYAYKAGFKKGNSLYSLYINNTLQSYKRIMTESYASCKKLIILLDTIVRSYMSLHLLKNLYLQSV